MKEKAVIGLLVLIAIIASACEINMPTTDTPGFYESSIGGINFLNHYNMAGQAPVDVTIIGSTFTSVVYESTDGSRFSYIKMAVDDSVTATGERKVKAYVPVCDNTITYIKVPKNIPTQRQGYILGGKTSTPTPASFFINDMEFGNTWTWVNGNGTTFVPLPLNLGQEITLSFDVGTSTNAGLKLWCI